MNDSSETAALRRSIDTLSMQVSELAKDMATLRVNVATLSGRFSGGTAVIVFIGTFATAVLAWLLGRHA